MVVVCEMGQYLCIRRRKKSLCVLGAIYIHQGEYYEVIKLDLEEMEARVVAKPDVKYYTRCKDRTEVVVLHRFHASSPVPRSHSIPSSVSTSPSVSTSASSVASTSSVPSTVLPTSSTSPLPANAAGSTPSLDPPSSSSLSSRPASLPSLLPEYIYYGRVKVVTEVFGFDKVSKSDI